MVGGLAFLVLAQGYGLLVEPFPWPAVLGLTLAVGAIVTGLALGWYRRRGAVSPASERD